MACGFSSSGYKISTKFELICKVLSVLLHTATCEKLTQIKFAKFVDFMFWLCLVNSQQFYFSKSSLVCNISLIVFVLSVKTDSGLGFKTKRKVLFFLYRRVIFHSGNRKKAKKGLRRIWTVLFSEFEVKTPKKAWEKVITRAKFFQ